MMTSAGNSTIDFSDFVFLLSMYDFVNTVNIVNSIIMCII